MARRQEKVAHLIQVRRNPDNKEKDASSWKVCYLKYLQRKSRHGDRDGRDRARGTPWSGTIP